MSAIKCLMTWLLSGACLAAAPPSPAEPPSEPLSLRADADGHFGGELQINGRSMPFMIDSGATFTTIPMKLAVEAGLPLGEQVETHTANGRSFAKTTRIASLRLGHTELKNLPAHANQHLQQVLLGINTLKYFSINQTAETMTLTVNKQMLQPEKLDAGVMVTDGVAPDSTPMTAAAKPYRPIVKSQVCNPGQRCITRYGN